MSESRKRAARVVALASLAALFAGVYTACSEAEAKRPTFRRQGFVATSAAPDSGEHPDADEPDTGDAGYDGGYDAGYDGGYDGGYDAGYDAGFPNANSTLFDGVDELVTITDNAALTSATTFTFSAWVEPVSRATDDVIVGKYGGSTNKEWSLRYHSLDGYWRFSVGTGAANYILGNASWVVGTWQHVCVQYDGSQADNPTRLRMWIDGTELTVGAGTASHVGTIPASVTDTTALLTIGAGSSGTPFAWGNAYVDEFSWFNALVSCSTLYASGNTLGPAATCALSGAVGLWRMGDAPDSEATFVNFCSPGTHNGSGVNLEAGDLQGNIPP